MLFVSHDRYFINRLANKIAVIEKQSLRVYAGGYAYYLEKNRKGKTCLDSQQLKDEVSRLECQLAYLGGRLSACDEQEQKRLDHEFKSVASRLRECREKLKEINRN
jgi:ATP-binding cassette subfamily F protein 3